jgi:hypothetical protein
MRPEDRLRSRVRMLLDAHLPPPGIWTSIDKGVVLAGDEQARMRQAAHLKAQGVKNGTEDVQVIYGLMVHAIELKIKTGLRSQQELRRDGLIANGHRYTVCHSVIEVYDALIAGGVPLEPSARIAAMHHDACLSEPESPKPKRSSKPRAARPTQAQLKRVAALRAQGLRF